MMWKCAVTCLVILLSYCRCAWALEPNEILVVANTNNAASVRLARYYCEKRGIPANRVIPVALGTPLRDTIGREDYDQRLAGPIRRTLLSHKDLGDIKCLVTTYGVPFRVGPRKPQAGYEAQLKQLRQLLEQEKQAVTELEQKGQTDSVPYRTHQLAVSQIQADIGRIMGTETEASVDSELSLVLCSGYELYRWQPNALRNPAQAPPFKTLMVSRLDGPSYGIAKGLIDKAMVAEEKGLTGIAYVDSRGLSGKDLYSYYDQSLRDLALLIRLRTSLPVKEERTAELFPPGSCPQTALYCGWYSVSKYVDAFEFVDGAVGYHIASFEAASLHDPNSTQWCPAMLKHGITATLGPVGEPYLHAFPEPKLFFGALFDGHCLVEAYYLTQPLNSWQMLLIGDPLYRPFKTSPSPAAGK
ncbi:MAG: TIGR03790 family protein [Phycisphaerae bacterium]|nr:TIGR03790 family protein [Phycisphaerae bacterium]